MYFLSSFSGYSDEDGQEGDGEGHQQSGKIGVDKGKAPGGADKGKAKSPKVRHERNDAHETCFIVYPNSIDV